MYDFNCLNIKWQIENFSYCWQENGECLYSSYFSILKDNSAPTRLGMFPKGYGSSRGINLFLERTEEKWNVEEVSFFLVTSKEPQVVPFKTVVPTHSPWISKFYLGKLSCFCDGKYFEEDTLTVKCKVKGTVNAGSCHQIQLYTRIAVDTKKFQIEIDNKISEKITNITSEKSGLTLGTLNYSKKRIINNKNYYCDHHNARKIDLHVPPSEHPMSYICKYSVNVRRQVNISGKKMFSIKPSNGKSYVIVSLLENKDFIRMYGNITDIILSGELSKVSYQLLEFAFRDGKNLRISKNVLDTYFENADLNLPQTLLQDLKVLHQTKLFSDLKLQVSEKTYLVHSIILACRSPVFKRMLETDMLEKSQQSIAIKDFSPKTVEIIIEFLYTDNDSLIDSDSVFELYTAADMYQIGALRIKCSQFLSQHLNKNNVCRVLKLADLHLDSDLSASANRFFFQNEYDIISSESWHTFQEQNSLLVARTQTAVAFMRLKKQPPFGISSSKRFKKDDQHIANLSLSVFSVEEDLKRLEEEKCLCDCRIQVGTKAFETHSAILAARSPEIVKLKKKQTSMVFEINDIDEDTVSRMIHFMYTDEVDDLDEQIAMKMMKAAQKYKLELMQKKCRIFLKGNLTIVNICSVLDVADHCKDENLKNAVSHFISKNEANVLLSENWEKLKALKPILILETLSNVSMIRLGLK